MNPEKRIFHRNSFESPAAGMLTAEMKDLKVLSVGWADRAIVVLAPWGPPSEPEEFIYVTGSDGSTRAAIDVGRIAACDCSTGTNDY